MLMLQTLKDHYYPPGSNKRSNTSGCSTLERGNLFFSDVLGGLFHCGTVEQVERLERVEHTGKRVGQRDWRHVKHS